MSILSETKETRTTTMPSVTTYYRKNPISVLKQTSNTTQALAIKSEYNSIPMYSDHTFTSRHFTKIKVKLIANTR